MHGRAPSAMMLSPRFKNLTTGMEEATRKVVLKVEIIVDWE